MNPGVERDKMINKLRELSQEQHTRIESLTEHVRHLSSLVALLIQDREASAWTSASKNPDGTPIPLARQTNLQLVGVYLRPLIAPLPPSVTRELKGQFAPYVQTLLTHMESEPEKHAAWTRILELLKAESITPEDLGMKVLEDGTIKVVFGPKPRPLFGWYP